VLGVCSWSRLKQVRAFAQHESGAVAQIFVLTLLPVLAFVGAALDYSRATSRHELLQIAIDRAVLAGAKDGTSNWVQTAQAVFDNTPRPSGASAGAFSMASGVYSGTASASVRPTLLSGLGIPPIPISARGSATAGGPPDTSCILAMDTGAVLSDAGITFNGAPNVAMTGCTIRSNTSLTCNGHSAGAKASIAAGTANGCSNPQSSADVVPDIYAALGAQIFTSCVARLGATWSPGSVPASVVTVQRAGFIEYHVCGDLTLSGSGTIPSGVAADSVIVIEDGKLILAANASIALNRTTIVLTGNNTVASFIDFPNGAGKSATLTLSPPTGAGNPWQGISIYQDPKLTFQIDENWGPGALLNAEGVVYMPNANVTVRGNNSTNNPTCTKLVVKTLTSNGAVNLNQTTQGCDALGVRQWAGKGALRLSQ
jgi:hypothetical protein